MPLATTCLSRHGEVQPGALWPGQWTCEARSADESVLPFSASSALKLRRLAYQRHHYDRWGL
ncbi:Hypothetical predicted protein [Marmota monax]|uniref:Uncharacterized protein n=1 Tax=Marmota monax TaxID=9995 RepID=A0A5E4CAC9_MARMO|nr:hypothetical protein GHT09_008003 [Marmota monax]VTJ77911.1 Hypothetical predicted protein [Marmota monax]